MLSSNLKGVLCIKLKTNDKNTLRITPLQSENLLWWKQSVNIAYLYIFLG